MEAFVKQSHEQYVICEQFVDFANSKPFVRLVAGLCETPPKREIEKSKVNYYADRVRNLQTIEPRKWHQEIRTMTRNVKSDLCIPVPGIEDSEHGDIANYINDAFVNVSSGISPLDIAKLESFLPACSPAPELYPWAMGSICTVKKG